MAGAITMAIPLRRSGWQPARRAGPPFTQPQSSVPPTYGAPAEANLAYERADLELDRRADHGAQPGGDRPLLSAIRVWGGGELVGVKGRAHGSPSLSSRSSTTAETSGPG
jgi:hypothetical protein